MPRVTLVTYDPRPDPSKDADLPLLLRALRETGTGEADAVYWDDPDADWGAYDLAVIRSTWDYIWRAAEFLAWAQKCAAASGWRAPRG